MREIRIEQESPRVAVLLSTYNGERYLTEQLDSLHRQSYKNFDLYVRDDGSSDSTLNILRMFAAEIPIKAIESGANVGVVRSFFNLLESAGDHYDFYAFCDQDDVWHEDKLKCAVELLGRSNQAIPQLYCCRLEYVSSTLEHLAYSRIPKKIGLGNAIVENVVTGCTAVFNANARYLVMNHKPQGALMHDWWMYLLISVFGEVIYDSRVLIKYRQHSSNTVGAATTFWDDYQRRFKRFFSNRRDGALNLSLQLAEFCKLHAAEISKSDRDLMFKVLSGKRSLANRIGLVFDVRIWRQSAIDNFILRILFLLNRY
jgi:glycosyltransferase involved in cell wall biosynthesis